MSTTPPEFLNNVTLDKLLSEPLYVEGFLSCSAVLVCSVIYLMFTGFTEQAAAYIEAEPVSVARRGAVILPVAAAAVAVLTVGVLLLPAAAVIAAAVLIAGAVGETAIGLWAGRAAIAALSRALPENGARGEFFKKIFSIFESNIVAYVIFGVIIIESLNFIPYLGWALRLIAVPALSLGAVASAAANIFVHKKFFETPSLKLRQSDKRIRDIILKGINKR